MTIKPVVTPTPKRSSTSSSDADKKEAHQVSNVSDNGTNPLNQHRNVVIDNHGQVCCINVQTKFIYRFIFFFFFFSSCLGHLIESTETCRCVR